MTSRTSPRQRPCFFNAPFLYSVRRFWRFTYRVADVSSEALTTRTRYASTEARSWMLTNDRRPTQGRQDCPVSRASRGDRMVPKEENSEH